MKRSKRWQGIFYWTDTEGIPLEMVVERCQRAGLNVTWELLIYASDALRAGWSRAKIVSELREAAIFGVLVPPELLGVTDDRRISSINHTA